MLESLDIRNLALIEDIHIEFMPGFNVLTGETGAGKSIILGALGLLLGEKGDSSVVRTGAQEASVSAVITINSDNPIVDWLQERGITLEDDSLLLHRVVKPSGRGSIYIQSVPMTKADLALISDALFDIHGQHEHQSLLYSDRQRRVLDSYGELGPLLRDYGNIYKKHEELLYKKRDAEETLSQAKKEADYLHFVAEELQRAQLKKDEDIALEEEIKILSQYETIHENLELVHESLRSSSNEGAITALATALQACKRAAKADVTLEEACSRLETTLLETQDIAESLRDKLSSMSFSQKRLDALQSRLAQLQRLQKKYGPSLDAVIAFHTTVMEKLAVSEASDEQLQELHQEIARIEDELSHMSNLITKKRLTAARKLERQIAERLTHLGMPHVVFSIAVQERVPTIHGADQVDFLFSANLGEPMRNLKEIASGGELSRVMLAIKTVLAEADDVETLVFDEVDAGIGGSVAIAVGEQMAELAQSRQVIVITHIASIAAKANRHFVVKKETRDGRTYTDLNCVERELRVQEIARMLSGHEQDKKALAHAQSMLVFQD